MTTVEIFTKPDCRLCDKAKDKLLAFKSELKFELKEINILDSDDLTERYGKLIPVIHINGLKFAEFDFEVENFRKIVLSYSS